MRVQPVIYIIVKSRIKHGLQFHGLILIWHPVFWMIVLFSAFGALAMHHSLYPMQGTSPVSLLLSQNAGTRRWLAVSVQERAGVTSGRVEDPVHYPTR